MDPREERYVQPFYLQMMRTNAVGAEPTLLTAIIEATRGATPAEVIWLLRGAWRPRVMGAWLSVRQSDPEVRDELLVSLRTSAGSLTSAPLATVAVIVLGQESRTALEAYRAEDLRHGWGSAGFIGAAISHLDDDADQPSGSALTTPVDLKDFEDMMRVAESLRAG